MGHAALKKRLIDLRLELQALDKAAKDAQAPVELDQQSVGRLSRMDAMQQQEMAQAEGRRRQNDITRIDAALKRIEEDEYGWCASCGEPIARKRLEIDPMAHLCIGCASA